MTASKIIEEIKRLDPKEQLDVICFAYRLDAERRLTGKELSSVAECMVNAADPAEEARIRESIAAASTASAKMPKIRRRNGAVGNGDMAGKAAR
jgi:hypothetical protein